MTVLLLFAGCVRHVELGVGFRGSAVDRGVYEGASAATCRLAKQAALIIGKGFQGM